MDNFERLKVVLYQYILFKGDFYKSVAEDSYNVLRSKKNPTSSDIHRFYCAQLKYEIFNDFEKEISDILELFLNP